MARVTFIGAKLLDRVQAHIHFDGVASLLALARQHGIPLPCECEKGKCGACAVKVATKRGAIAQTQLTGKEKRTLLAMGKISHNEFSAESLPINPPLWRLACEYRIADEDIVVAF